VEVIVSSNCSPRSIYETVNFMSDSEIEPRLKIIYFSFLRQVSDDLSDIEVDLFATREEFDHLFGEPNVLAIYESWEPLEDDPV
jgi:hypothetical protein